MIPEKSRRFKFIMPIFASNSLFHTVGGLFDAIHHDFMAKVCNFPPHIHPILPTFLDRQTLFSQEYPFSLVYFCGHFQNIILWRRKGRQKI